MQDPFKGDLCSILFRQHSPNIRIPPGPITSYMWVFGIVWVLGICGAFNPDPETQTPKQTHPPIVLQLLYHHSHTTGSDSSRGNRGCRNRAKVAANTNLFV